jgi:predicted esterase
MISARLSVRAMVAALCGTLLLVTSATSAPAAAGPSRGALVSVTPVARWDAGQVGAYLTRFGLDNSRVRFGAVAARVVYRTVGAHGRPTTASALVVVPRTEDRTPRQVVWLHGTTAYRGSVASMTDGNDRAAALLFASAGFLTTAPDYLGLGAGPGFHPYAHADSSVTASIDALRATRELAARHHRRPDPRVFVTGHSQGGHVAMALGRALQGGVDRRLGLGGLAPISAPLQPSRLVADALAGKGANGVAYLAYWTVAWNRLFDLYDSPADAFRDPSIESLFDGDHPNEQIFPRLPATVAELFTPAYLARLRHPAGVLASELRAADRFCDWRPRVPVRLYAAAGDRDVSIANAVHCRGRLEKHHADVSLADLGAGADHATSAKLALPRVLAGFDDVAG